MLYQTNAAKETMKVQLHLDPVPVYIESYVYEPGFFRFNWHSSYELLTVLEGAVDVYRDGQVQPLQTDDVIVINPQQGHATIASHGGTRLLLVHLQPESLWPKSGSIPRFQCCSTTETRQSTPFVQLRFFMAQLYTGLADGDTAGRCSSLGAHYNIGALLLRQFQMGESSRGTATDERQIQRLREVFAYTDAHYTDAIRMDELAAHLDLNPAYLSAFFHERLGIPYSEYLARKRLQHAVHLLNNTSDSLATIAAAVGFPSVRALNIAFQRYFEMSIRQYRETTGSPTDSRYKTQFPQYLDRSDPAVQSALHRYLTGITSP